MGRVRQVSEADNEARVVNWLGLIAVVSMLAVVYLAANASKTKIGIDSAVIVALIGVTAAATSSLGTRRTQQQPTTTTTSAPPSTTTTTAPPSLQSSPAPPPAPPVAGEPNLNPLDDDFLGH